MIELVIKIPEEIYKLSQILDVKYEDTVQIPLEVIANGTPLPKGHGDLIDENEVLKTTKSYKSELGRLKADPFVKMGIETVENFIRDLSPIIEADKAESEDKE